MDRSREVRRGPPMANGFLRRRPQRNGGGGGMRDSPEEGMAGELPESAAVRLRDRKKDRLNRNKRRRGERLHGNREEGGEESSEESVDVEDDEDDDDEEAAAAANLRRTVQPPVMKIVKPQWKVTDEMIGVPVPRKARSASVKRSHETSVSGSGERCPDQIPVKRPSSTSPATPSPAAVSPSSSNASIRRRVKPVGAKQKPAKVSKVSIQEEIEIEVAEVLFGLRQHPTASANPDTSSYTSSPKVEPKEEESSALAGKPRVISPQQPLNLPRISTPTAGSISSAVATQKRKRPRPGKSEEEKSSCAVSGVAPIGAPAVVATKNDMEKMEASSPPKQENDCVLAAINGVDRALKAEISWDAVKPHLVPETKAPSADGGPETKRIPVSAEKIEPKEEPTSTAKLEIDQDSSAKGVSLVPKVSDVLKEERFQIDLMAPPSKSVMDGEINGDSVMEIDTINMKDDIDTAERKEEAAQVEQEVAAKAPGAEKRAEASEGCDATALSSERMLDLRLDAEKSDMEGGKQQNQKHSRAARTDPKALEVEKSATPSSGAAGAMVGPSSLPLGMHLAGWPGGLPPIGYIGQAPANWPGAPPLHPMVPMEGNSGAPPTLQPHVLLPQPRHKRCATHCYIAQMINYYQQLARINPYWAAASNASLFGAKAYNLNAMPSTEGVILSNTLPGGAFPAASFAAATRTPSSVQEKGSGGAVNLGSHTSKEKASATLKQRPGPQQPTHPASAASIPVPGAAVLFPLNQVAETGRPGGIKAPVAGNAAGTAPVQVGGAMGGTGPVGMATVSYNFANLPTNDAQYIAMVQGSGFPFPIPAHVGVAAAATAASSYRGSQGGQQGTATGAAVPPPPQQFFNGSFYASHVLHPAQVQQAQSQAFQQQGQQNPANSNGSSSSQKHHQQRLQGSGNSRQPQQQRTPSQSPGNSLHPNHRTSGSSQPRQGESEAGHAHGDGDSSTMADSKVSPLQKSLYTPNNHLHQTLNPGYGMSPVAVPMIMSALGGGKNGEKQPQNSEAHLHYGLKGMELMPSQAFAMSFAPGVDFSMAPGHHAVFHSLPESYRQNYQLSTAQAAAVAAAAQQQHAQRTAVVQKIGEDAKNTTDTVGGPPTRQEDRKAGSGKLAPPISSHSLTFSRQPENNNENSSISIFSSSSTHVPNQEAVLDNSSRTINLSSNPANGICATRPPPSATSTGQQQQQHHQPAISHSRPAANNVGVSPVSMQSAVAISYPDRLLGSKFPGSLSALPQALVQGGAAPQSPQWRSTAGVAPSSRTPAPASAPSPPKQTKNSAGIIGPGSSSTAPTQISFGSSAVNPKVTAMSMTGHMPANSSLNGNPSIASPASVRLNSSSTLQVVSPPTSITKSTGGASTRASTASKGVVVPATSPTISQQNKSTPSSTSRKHSPPVGGRSNLPSILGHPQLGQASSPKQPLPQQQPLAQPSNLKHQQQLSQQHQKPQFHQAQMLFANTYLPAQSLPPLTAAAAAAAAAGYYQTRAPAAASLSYQSQRRTASEQQPQQNSSSPASSNPVATGAVTLGPPSLGSSSDSLKSGGPTGSSLKSSTGSLPPHPFSTSSSASTNSGNHPNAASAVMAAFPYIHAVSTAPLKSAEQNSAAGKHKQEKIQ